ncbi:hypothetical protein EQP59_05200 [Ornithobacterium rhinotracheale]|uniref:Uncharacterized protein n=1 Tax=Ornithobacterium rhinotracheale TaxID=28251 RepID=A0A410JRL7_ORNRH|nr:hypothetical protein [Ornithobacterium rhinotracheale]QAR30776.1 hypothetical protein EQP59_05200 [Ornithobacterium rhinotracheale]
MNFKIIILLIGIVFLWSCKDGKKTTSDQNPIEISENSAEEIANTFYVLTKYHNEKFEIKVNEITKNQFNKNDFSKKQDNNITQLFAENITQKPDKIILNFDNHQSKTLANNEGTPYDENRVHYSYQGYLPTFNAFVVKTNGYENVKLWLFNKENGKKIELIGIPFLNPSKKLFYCFDYNPFEDEDTTPEILPPTYDLYIYQHHQDKITKLAKIKIAENQEIKEAYWEDDNNLKIQTKEKYLHIKIN